MCVFVFMCMYECVFISCEYDCACMTLVNTFFVHGHSMCACMCVCSYVVCVCCVCMHAWAVYIQCVGGVPAVACCVSMFVSVCVFRIHVSCCGVNVGCMQVMALMSCGLCWGILTMSQDNCKEMESLGAKCVGSPAEVAAMSDVVITMLPASTFVSEVCLWI